MLTFLKAFYPILIFVVIIGAVTVAFMAWFFNGGWR